MAASLPTPPSAPLDAYGAAFAWWNALAQAQRAQFEALTSWQQSLAAFNNELWDAWICRWAGGVPIDA